MKLLVWVDIQIYNVLFTMPLGHLQVSSRKLNLYFRFISVATLWQTNLGKPRSYGIVQWREDEGKSGGNGERMINSRSV